MYCHHKQKGVFCPSRRKDDVGFFRRTLIVSFLMLLIFGCQTGDKKVVNQTPHHLEKGFSQLNAGNLDSAEDYFRQVLSDEPKNGRALLGLGEVFLARGDDYRAEQFLRQAVGNDPSLSIAYGLIGEIYIQRGDEAEALKFFEKCPPEDPHYANLHYYLGRRYLEIGENHLAKDEFELALTHPEFWGGHWGMGYLEYQKNNYDDALTHFRRAASLNPEPIALLGLADALFALGKDTQAHFFYLRYMAEAPESPERKRAEQNLAQLKERVGEFAACEKVTFKLDKDKNVKVAVYNEEGSHLKDLFTGFLCRGNYLMGWDGKDFDGGEAEGSDFYGIVELGDSTIIQKIEPGN